MDVEKYSITWFWKLKKIEIKKKNKTKHVYPLLLFGPPTLENKTPY